MKETNILRNILVAISVPIVIVAIALFARQILQPSNRQFLIIYCLGLIFITIMVTWHSVQSSRKSALVGDEILAGATAVSGWTLTVALYFVAISYMPAPISIFWIFGWFVIFGSAWLDGLWIWLRFRLKILLVASKLSDWREQPRYWADLVDWPDASPASLRIIVEESTALIEDREPLGKFDEKFYVFTKLCCVAVHQNVDSETLALLALLAFRQGNRLLAESVLKNPRIPQESGALLGISGLLHDS